jgi:hypothetical protein
MAFLDHFDLSDVVDLTSRTWSKNQLGKLISPLSIDMLLGLDKIPKVVIVGFCKNSKEEKSLYAIREQLYSLYWHNSSCEISDLGNFLDPDDPEVPNLIAQLTGLPSTVILLSSRVEVAHSIYLSYVQLQNTLNLLICDSIVRLGSHQEKIDDQNYMGHIVSHEPNYLFNASFVAYQTNLNKPEELHTIEKFNFDLYRLGVLKSDIHATEPLARNTDFAILSINSVRKSDAPSNQSISTNGLFSEEFCQIARYCGISNKLSTCLISGFERNEIDKQTLDLIAQSVWFVAEGVHNRIDDGSLADDSVYLIYKVTTSLDNTDIVFYKNKLNGRWWMKVPLLDESKNRFRRHQIIPCLLSDYQQATSGEIPENWWRAFQKLM